MRIRSERVYIHGTFIPAEIKIEDGIIEGIYPYEAEIADYDYGNQRIVPGFIDVHCHGGYGFDTNSADPEGLKMWAAKLAEEGVTGFLPTTVTDYHDNLLKAVKNVREVASSDYEGARILGIHLEGPWLNKERKGAQPEDAIVPPSADEFDEFCEASGNLVRLITVAPEKDEKFRMIRHAAEKGVVVSMGHTSATYQQAVLACANGVKSITHTYNAMTPFSHRENGVVGAALRLHDLYSEIIADCSHSTPDALNIFYRSKDRGKAIMISDSLMCKGAEPGSRFIFGGQQIVIYPDGSAHLEKEGNLAGSTLKINEGLRNLTERAMVPFADALDSCTINPAVMLGMDDRIGRLAAGCDADLVVLDNDYEVVQTFIKGKPVLPAEDE